MLNSRLSKGLFSQNYFIAFYKLCAFLFDLAFANILHFALMVLDGPQLFKGVYSTREHLLSLYILLFVLRMYFVLMVGVSPGQWLMGFYSQSGGFVWKRIGGSLRTAIEFFLTPLLMLDSFRKDHLRDWKEFLSATRVVIDLGPIKPIKSVIILISSFILFTFAPLLTDFKNSDGWVVSFHESKIPKLDKGSNFENYKIHMSNRFHFKTLSSLMDGRFQLIPGFEIKRTNNKSIMTPMFSVYDRQLKITSDVRMIKRLSIEGLVKHFTKGNPFFSLSYPALTHIDSNPGAENLFRGELLNFTRLAFSMSAQNIFKYPFIAPSLVEYRKYLLSQLRPGAVPEVDLVEMGNAVFLRFRQNFGKTGEWADKFIETYLPLINNEVVMWEMIWQRGLNDALGRGDFLSAFFASAEWFYGDADLYQLPENEFDMRPLMLVDYFIKKELNTKQVIAMEGHTYHLFFDLARMGFERSDEGLLKIIEDRVLQFDLIIKMRTQGEEKFFSEDFARQMQELLTATKVGDRSYFGL